MYSNYIELGFIKKIALFFVILTVFFSKVSGAHNETVDKSNLSALPKLSVVTEVWYPFNYLDKNGQIVGRSTKAVKSILDHAGILYDINLYPWKRAYLTAQNQPNTLIYSLFKTPDREDLFHWICPISKNVVLSVYKLSTRKNLIINSEEDFSNYTINVSRDSFPHELLKNKGLRDGKEIKLTATNQASLGLLINKNVDLIIELEETIENMLEKKKLSKNIIEKVYVFNQHKWAENCMALSKGTSPELISKIKKSYQVLYNK